MLQLAARARFSININSGDKRDRTAVFCLSEGVRKTKGHAVCVAVNYDGGDKRDRTADLLNAIQALSQLSYTPKRHV